MVGWVRGAVVEKGEGFGFEPRERENGLGSWVDGEGAVAVESAEGMAGGGALELLFIFGNHCEVNSVIIHELAHV